MPRNDIVNDKKILSEKIFKEMIADEMKKNVGIEAAAEGLRQEKVFRVQEEEIVKRAEEILKKAMAAKDKKVEKAKEAAERQALRETMLKKAAKSKSIHGDPEPANSDVDEKLLELMDNLDEIVQKSPPDDELTDKEATIMKKLLDQLPAEPPKTTKEWNQALKTLQDMAAIFRDHNSLEKKSTSDINTKLAKTCNLGDVVDYPKLKLSAVKVICKNTTRNEIVLGLPNGKYGNYEIQLTSQAGSMAGDKFLNGSKFKELSDTYPYFVVISGDTKVVCSDDLPTEVDSNGNQMWKVKGQLHRENGPAFIGKDGTKQWVIKGNLHRTDGPAYEMANGHKQWFLNGQLHRDDGPAHELANGRQEWYQHGTLHRENGPARIDKDGTKSWIKKGQYHRVGGPAIEYVNGDKNWWVNGKQHRVDGPAVELADGTKEWFTNGKRHRKDGPAIEWSDGYKEWWINGHQSLEAPSKSIEANLTATTEILKSISDSLLGVKINTPPLDMEFEVNDDGDLIFSFEEEEPSFGQTFKDDLKQAGYRVAANQISKGVKTAIVSMMQKGGSSSTHLHTISEMLNTQYGAGLISFLLGMGLQHTDLVQDERVEKIAEEFRIEGMSGVGNQVFSFLMDALVPVVSKTLHTLPQEETRISTTIPLQIDNTLLVEEHFEEEIPHEMIMDTSG